MGYEVFEATKIETLPGPGKYAIFHFSDGSKRAGPYYALDYILDAIKETFDEKPELPFKIKLMENKNDAFIVGGIFYKNLWIDSK